MHLIKPSSENGKYFIYIINPLIKTNTTIFPPSLWRTGWRCLLEQSASQRWKLLLFIWCFSSLLDILRWNRKDSHYHIEMSALKKKGSWALWKRSTIFLNRRVGPWKYSRIRFAVTLTDRKEEPGLQEIGLDDFLRSKFFKYWFWPTV